MPLAGVLFLTGYRRKRFNHYKVWGTLTVLCWMTSIQAQNIIRVWQGPPADVCGPVWTNVQTDLTDVLMNQVSAGDEVWIARGTYLPTAASTTSNDPRMRHFRIPDNIKIRGGFEGWETDPSQRCLATNPTILSGEIQQDANQGNNCLHVVKVNNTTNVVVEGIIVEDGSASQLPFNAGSQLHRRGGGMLMGSCSNIRFRNCIFRNNFAFGRGGAIQMTNSNTGVIFQNVLFVGNAVRVEATHTGVLAEGQGGAIYFELSAPIFRNCTFHNNSVTNVHVPATTARSGGGAISQVGNGMAVVRNCIFRGNTRNVGGVSTLQCMHSFATNAPHYLVHDTFWDAPQSTQIHTNSSNNTNTNPQLNPVTCVPNTGSPVIDYGSTVGLPFYDLNNGLRLAGSQYDCGAFEFREMQYTVSANLSTIDFCTSPNGSVTYTITNTGTSPITDNFNVVLPTGYNITGFSTTGGATYASQQLSVSGLTSGNSVTLTLNLNTGTGAPGLTSLWLIPENYPCDRVQVCLNNNVTTFTTAIVGTCPSLCGGSITVNVTSGLPGYTYLLNGTVTTSVMTNLCPGTYTVGVVNANNCTTSVAVVVPMNSQPWPKIPVTTATNYADARAVSAEMNGLYMAGEFNNQIEFPNVLGTGNITLTSNGGEDAYLVRYDHDCGAVWAFNVGSVNNNEYGKVMVQMPDTSKTDGYLLVGFNVSGNLPGGLAGAAGPSVVNTINGGMDLSTAGLSLTSKALIAKVKASDGSVVWVHAIGENASETTRIKDLKISPTGNLIATGEFRGNITNNASQTASQNGSWDAFLYELTPSGSFVNFASWGTVDDDLSNAVAVKDNAYGRYYVTTGKVSYKTVTVPGMSSVPATAAVNGYDAYVAEFGFSFTGNNFRVFSAPGNDQGNDLTVENTANSAQEGHTYVVGKFEDHMIVTNTNTSTVSVPSNPVGMGVKHAFILQLDPSLDHVAHTTDGGNGGKSAALSVLLDQGNLYTTGKYEGGTSNFNFLGGLTVLGSGTEGFVTSHSGNGSLTLMNADNVVHQNGNNDRVQDIAKYSFYGELVAVGTLMGGGTADFWPNYLGVPLPSNVGSPFMVRRYLSGGFYLQPTPEHTTEIPERTVEQSLDLKVYPNPTKGQLFIDLNRPISVLEMTNGLGKVVYSNTDVESGIHTLDLEQLTTGIYFIRIVSEGTNYYQKVVKH